jgi:uncharacterized protein (TIGR02271 family)
MANKPPVHVELRGDEWAVIREGRDRAASTHTTQAEAAEAGREMARRDETTFLLHGRDGRVRETSDYCEGSGRSEDEHSGGVGAAVGEIVQGAGRTAGQTIGDVGRALGGRQTPDDARAEGSSGGTGIEPAASGRERDEPPDSPEDRYANYEVFDQDGEKLGKLDDLFLDEHDEPEYIGVRTGTPGTGSTLIPANIVTLDEQQRRMIVSRPASAVRAGPGFGGADDVTPGLEQRARSYYGLTTTGRETADEEPSSVAGSGVRTGGIEAGAFREHPREWEGLSQPGSDLEDELRIQRSEEELQVSIREREAGSVNVRKRVRTDRESVTVPRRREEVTVERVPVEGGGEVAEGETAAAEIGEDEIVIPIVEEELVVEKRPVIKEEIRIRKRVVEDVEVVEEEVRREEVEVVEDVEDTTRGPEPEDRGQRPT